MDDPPDPERRRVTIDLTAAQDGGDGGGSHEALILESATGYAILTTDLAGCVTAWNEGARRLLGWDEAEALGRDARMIFPPEDRAAQAPEAEMEGALTRGQAEDERWHLRKDGSRFFASGLLMPLRGADGASAGFLKIVRDRTHEIEAGSTQAALRTQADALAARQAAILGQLAEGVIVTDAEGRIAFVNRAAVDIHGVERLDVEPDAYSETYHLFTEDGRPYPPLDLPLARAVLKGETVSEARWLIRRPDGTEVLAIGSARPISGSSGDQIGAVLTLRDATAAEAAQRALRESEARFRNMADHAPVMMWVTDPTGACTYLNRRWYEFTGQTPEEAEGFGWLDATHPEDKERADEIFRAANAAQGVFRVEYRLRRADGAYRWAIDAASPRFAEDGSFLGYVGSVIDIDERREMENALRASESRHRFRVELGDGLRGLTTPTEIMAAVSERLGPYLGVDQANYYAIDGERFVVTEEWRTSASPSVLGSHRLADFGEGTLARMSAGQALRLDDTRTVEGSDAFAAAGMAAVLSVPLLQDEQWAAGLHVHQSRPRAWTDDEEALLREVAAHAWVAVERVRAERTLRASEEFNRRVLASSADCIKVLDLEGRLEFMSEGGMGVMEVDDFAAIDRADWPAFWSGDAHAKALASLDEARRGGTGRFDGFATTMRGSPRWWDVAVTPINGPDGAPERLLSVSRDITAQREAQARLRELNETLERRVEERTAERDRMWETSPDLMLVIDFEGVFRRVNPAWTTLLGYAPEELVGHHVNEFVLTDDHGETTNAYELAAAGGRPMIVNRYRHKDGSIRWISWTAAPAGNLTYATGRNITLEKEREAELEAAQEQLRQSQKMEAVGQLTGGIAHDFNNLLAGIVGSLDLLQTRIRQGRTAEIDRYVTAAMTSAQRAAALTHRLLAFSRRQPLDPKPVEANRLVAGMEELLRRTLGPAVALEMVLAGGLWRTLCDPVQLESALLNLCINARDAMPEGGKLTIETANAHLDDAYAAAARDVTPGQYVAICVTDTGTGIPPDVIARVFDPFFTTKPIGQGTGLGLSMVYGFTKQSEGHVRVYSEEGQGTTVKVYLPRHRGAAEEEGGSQTVAEAPRAEAGETVLVVEDEPVVRSLIVEVLQDLGYRALEANDGPAGLKLLQSRQRIDLLITDVGLPGGINGRQLADQGREKRPDLKVLFITGYAENAALANGFLEPGMQMVTKPFAIDALALKIRQMIEGTTR